MASRSSAPLTTKCAASSPATVPSLDNAEGGLAGSFVGRMSGGGALSIKSAALGVLRQACSSGMVRQVLDTGPCSAELAGLGARFFRFWAHTDRPLTEQDCEVVDFHS